MRVFLALALVTLGAHACGGGDGASPDAAMSVDADNDAGHDGSTILDSGFVDAADGSMTTITPTSLLPLRVGNRWAYEVLVSEGCVHEPVMWVLRSEPVGGHEAFIVLSPCSGMELAARYVGDEVYGWSGEEWLPGLPSPVDNSTSWTISPLVYSWERVGPFTVPAGTFDECWNRVARRGEDRIRITTYCAGIGMVREELPLPPTASTIVLSSYELVGE